MINRAKGTVKWVALLLLVTVLFYWKILLTNQFSLLTGSEAVNQGYSWYQFWISTIRQGTLPLWDPYTFSGRSFAGEMLGQAFHPFSLLVSLAPFDNSGLLSPQLYNAFFALAHFLGACFMFVLVREFRLSRFSAMVAAICFSLGGFVGEVTWPNYLWASIWLPVIFLFLMRAFNADTLRLAMLQASLAGPALGMAILAGGLHMAIMQAIVVFTAAAFQIYQSRGTSLTGRYNPWIRPVLVFAVVAGMGLAAGAVQLFPSMEYSGHAVRWFGAHPPLPAAQRIPYAHLRDGVAPQGVFMLLLFTAFGGNVGAGEFNPYLGVFPLLLGIIGAWKAWGNPWVRYLTGLAACAFLFSLGSFSLLHGLAYALIPFLWMAREAGRFLYLTDFALAILIAFGSEALFSAAGQSGSWDGLSRILKRVAIGGLVILCSPAFFGQVHLAPPRAFSILLILVSCALFFYIADGHAGGIARFLTIALILSDLSAFDGTALNKIAVASRGTDQFERLLSCQGAAHFLKSQAGLFRVQVLAASAPNIGDAFQIQTTQGAGPTMLMHYLDLTATVPAARDILNVRYVLKPATSPEPGAIYQDAAWKVYENAQAFPRAWLAHSIEVEPTREKLLKRLQAPDLDLHRVAILSHPLEVGIETATINEPEEVNVRLYEANQLELRVRAGSRALLVLSEIYYPGWQAMVNGRPASIHETDGVLRGILVEPGENYIKLRYRPGWMPAGTVLTALAFSIPLVAYAIHSRKASYEPGAG